MTTPNNNLIPQDEYDYLWQAVRDEPDGFDSWEQLIRVAETPPQGLTKTSPSEHLVRLENVYDSFLTRFPLCYVYWKKYADWQLALRGEKSAEKVFERGVTAIHNSIDLWNQYIDFKSLHKASNDQMESLFERAAQCVGLDFLAHTFWDKYIEFIKTRWVSPKRLLALLDRIVIIPMHQYARYYEHWHALRTQMAPAEILDPDTLAQWTQNIQEKKGSLNQKELNNALKEKIKAQTKPIYKKTQEGTNKRWIYEAEIKRPYFHFKPLDRPQLQNWSRYLDFEELQGDQQRIRVLYERCLVTCAQYEAFWMRYGQWLAENDLLHEARDAYERAAYTFLPRECTTAKIALALILEEQGKADNAKQIYTTLLESMPTHIEVILNYLHFERRQNPNSFHNLVNNYIYSPQLDESSKAFFTIQYIRYLQQNNQIDRARDTYSLSASLYPHNKLLWLNYINFELGFNDRLSSNRITQVFKQARQHLPKHAQKEIIVKYREYLLERGTSIVALNRLHVPVSTEFIGQNNLKRTMDDDKSNDSLAKQPRT